MHICIHVLDHKKCVSTWGQERVSSVNCLGQGLLFGICVLVPALIHLLTRHIRAQEQVAGIGNLIWRYMRPVTRLVRALVILEVASQISEF